MLLTRASTRPKRWTTPVATAITSVSTATSALHDHACAPPAHVLGGRSYVSHVHQGEVVPSSASFPATVRPRPRAAPVAMSCGCLRSTYCFLLTARADTPAQLRALHRRVDRAGPVIRVTVIGVEVAVVLAVVAAVAAGGEAVAAWPFVVVVAVTGWAAAAKIRASRARRVWAR